MTLPSWGFFFIFGAQEAPAVCKLPEEHCLHSPGTGSGGLRALGGRSSSLVTLGPVAWQVLVRVAPMPEPQDTRGWCHGIWCVFSRPPALGGRRPGFAWRPEETLSPPRPPCRSFWPALNLQPSPSPCHFSRLRRLQLRVPRPTSHAFSGPHSTGGGALPADLTVSSSTG